jgi:hypothetical protein
MRSRDPGSNIESNVVCGRRWRLAAMGLVLSADSTLEATVIRKVTHTPPRPFEGSFVAGEDQLPMTNLIVLDRQHWVDSASSWVKDAVTGLACFGSGVDQPQNWE